MSQEYIEIHGARENNLKNISLRMPKRKITFLLAYLALVNLLLYLIPLLRRCNATERKFQHIRAQFPATFSAGGCRHQ
jgi:hypothetical protein